MPLLRSIGILLIGVSVIGFITVADDLRHLGELVGVSAIGLIGALLAVLPRQSGRKNGESNVSREVRNDA